jgi:hypothetical protein
MRKRPKTEVRSQPFGNTTIIKFSCVEKCKNNSALFYNRCYEKNSDSFNEEKNDDQFLSNVSEDLMNSWHKIFITTFIAFLLSYAILMLFRYAINYVIWIVFGSFIVVFGICALTLWIQAKVLDAIIFSIFTAVGIFVIFYFRKRIQLIAELFKEASKALIDVPSILFEPLLTFASLLLAFILFVYFLIVIATAGNPVNIGNPDGSPHVIFVEDEGISIAGFLNIVAFLWFTQFIIGCQHFVIAGKNDSF